MCWVSAAGFWSEHGPVVLFVTWKVLSGFFETVV